MEINLKKYGSYTWVFTVASGVTNKCCMKKTAYRSSHLQEFHAPSYIHRLEFKS